MSQGKRVRRGTEGWRKLFSRQSSSGLTVQEVCQRERINDKLGKRPGLVTPTQLSPALISA